MLRRYYVYTIYTAYYMPYPTVYYYDVHVPVYYEQTYFEYDVTYLAEYAWLDYEDS